MKQNTKGKIITSNLLFRAESRIAELERKCEKIEDAAANQDDLIAQGLRSKKLKIFPLDIIIKRLKKYDYNDFDIFIDPKEAGQFVRQKEKELLKELAPYYKQIKKIRKALNIINIHALNRSNRLEKEIKKLEELLK